MPTVRLSTGIDMYYEEAGEGEPLVLSYGAAGHHAPWEPQIAELSRSFRVITPDTRGTGKSDKEAKRAALTAAAAEQQAPDAAGSRDAT